MKVREIIRIIEDDGWYLVRTKGSHRQFHHPEKKGTVTGAGNPNVDVPIGTLKRVYEQAQIERE
jgi:predicted RNA binding protein YcfA (HicA-like mRNA interferase family)